MEVAGSYLKRKLFRKESLFGVHHASHSSRNVTLNFSKCSPSPSCVLETLYVLWRVWFFFMSDVTSTCSVHPCACHEGSVPITRRLACYCRCHVTFSPLPPSLALQKPHIYYEKQLCCRLIILEIAILTRRHRVFGDHYDMTHYHILPVVQ